MRACLKSILLSVLLAVTAWTGNANASEGEREQRETAKV